MGKLFALFLTLDCMSKVNVIGILLVTTGTVMVWKYISVIGLTARRNPDKDGAEFIYTIPTAKGLRKIFFNRKVSILGIILVVIGSILQIISNF